MSLIGKDPEMVPCQDSSNTDLDIPLPQGNPSNSHILSLDTYLSDLASLHKSDLKQLLNSYSKVTADLPDFFNIIQHNITLISENTNFIKQPSYCLNPIKKEIMKSKVEFMLNNQLAEPNLSPRDLPCLLIPNPDGSSIFCTDYRKVNQVTVLSPTSNR